MPTVLVVDDFDVKGLKTVIEKRYVEGIEVLTATTKGEAEGVLEARGDDIDVVVLDIYMPDNEPGGFDLARRIAGKYPIIFISGHPEEHFAAEIGGLGPLAFLQKPVDPGTLAGLIRFAVQLRHQAQQPDAVAVERYCGRPATLAVARFMLRELNVAEAVQPFDMLWDFPPLAECFRKLEQCAEAHHGRILQLGGLSSLMIFPGSGQAGDHFNQAIEALRQAARETARIMTNGVYAARFCAGVLPGNVVGGLFGDCNPGHAAAVGRTEDVARFVSYTARESEVATVRQWLSTAQANLFGRLGNGRQEQMSIPGITGLVNVLYKHL